MSIVTISKKMFRRYGAYIAVAMLFVLLNMRHFLLAAQRGGSVWIGIYEASLYFFIFLFLAFLLSFRRRLNALWLSFLFFVATLALYFIDTMGIEINRQIIANVVATNPQETFELLSKRFFLYVGASCIVSVLLYAYLRCCLIAITSKKRYFFVMFVVVGAFFLVSSIDQKEYYRIIKRETPSIVPINILKAIPDYVRVKDRSVLGRRKDISNDFERFYTTPQPLIAVVVIGESARADRFGILGYQRETTPRLRNVSHLFAKSASACDTSTLSSVPCMLVRRTRKEFDFPIQEQSFISIMRQHGFKTYWLTIQREVALIRAFRNEAETVIDYANKKRFDGELLEDFQKIVRHTKQDTLIVVHTFGSHIDYNNRVPQKFMKFRPVCRKEVDECRKDTLNNSYDNTIVYTDEVLSRMIEILRPYNAFLLYSSDHGESLGEKQYGVFARYGHASPLNVAPKAQTQVPFFFWYSKTFRKYYDIRHEVSTVSHDFIFHTVLGCSGFRSKLLREEYNLCHPKRREKK